jgi:hypothetical protein
MERSLMACVLKCPECRGKFPWDPTKPHPKTCPLCDHYIGIDRADDDVVMPAFLSGKTKRVDMVYDSMVRGSEMRAEKVANDYGGSKAESGMVMTNMRDGMREGDIAAPPVNNAITQFMDQTKVGGFQGDGLGYSSQVATGFAPNQGARMRTVLQNTHGAHGGAVSDRPALETIQPGYRRRG